MEYALYNGLRTAARPTLKAVCEHCGTEVIAKCGSKKIWHWAHTSLESCDSWYEPETAWHRNWKHVFGEGCSEIRVVKDGTYHIADVINKDGTVFELQNSSISSEVIAAREAFYGEKMIWIINGDSFKGNFAVYEDVFINEWKVNILDEFEAAGNYAAYKNSLIIEDWQVKQEAVSQLLKRLDFMYSQEAGMYYRPFSGMINRSALEKHVFEEIKLLYESQKQARDFEKGTFTWLRPRKSWEDATRPVFIDLGEDYLYWVITGMGKTSGTGVKIRKERFVEKYAGN